jgi:hypothetical protein
MNNPREGARVAWAIACAACSGLPKGDASVVISRPVEAKALCGVELAASWSASDGAPGVSIDCTPVWGPTLILDLPNVVGGTYVATFGGAGVPSYGLQPEPRATQMTVSVPVECDKQPRTLRLRIDVSHPQSGRSVPFTVEPGPSDVSVRMSPAR